MYKKVDLGTLDLSLFSAISWFFILSVLFLVSCNPGNDEGSMSSSKNQLDAADSTALSLVRSSEAAFRNGDYRTALAFTDSAKQYAAGLPDIYFQRAHIFTALKNYDAAKNAYEEVITLDPDHRGVYFNLGNVYFREGDFTKALSMYEQERQKHPFSPQLLSRVLMNMARAYTRTGNTDSARYAFDRALQYDSTNTAALMWAGQFFQDEGEFEKALEFSRRGLRQNPENIDYQFVVGTQYSQLGKLDSAAHYLENVVEERPWYSSAVSNLGQVLLRQGKQERGKELLARADTLRQWDSKIEELEANAQIYNNTVDWIKLGYALQKSGRLKEARDAFNVALTLDPNNLSYHNIIANLSVYLGDTVEAIRRYRSIIAADSSMVSTWINLGIVYYNTGELNKARQAFQNALKYNPDHQVPKAYLDRLTTG